MKKSLIALSVLAAVAGTAQAQSSVTIYGVVDMALQHQNTGDPAGSTLGLDSGIQSGSRLGFKGSEDLGGGLKANFQLEMGINADTGSSAQGGRAFGRQAFVGLSGNFGAVNFGRQYTPAFIAIDSFDPFGTGITSSTAGSGSSGFGAAAYFDHGGVRMNNSATYSTANLGGFTGTLAYGFGEVAGNTTAGRYIGFSGAYSAGPLFAELAYSNAQNANGSNATKSYLLAGTYNFDVVTAHAGFSSIKDDGAGVAALDRRVWLLGATVPVGSGNIIASYIRSTNQNSLLKAANGTQLALGYTYSLSKRTNLYTSVSRATNDANINLGSADSSATFKPVPNGATVRMVNVGIRHKF